MGIYLIYPLGPIMWPVNRYIVSLVQVGLYVLILLENDINKQENYMTHVKILVKGQATPIILLNTRIHPTKMELKRLRLARKEVIGIELVNNPVDANSYPGEAI